MNFEPDHLQQLLLLLLWRLAVSDNGGEYLKQIECNLRPAKRKSLVREALIDEEKVKPVRGGRGLTHLALTEKGWSWCQNNLGREIKSRSPMSAIVLHRLLSLLEKYFQNQETTVSFGQFIQQAQIKKPSKLTESVDGPAADRDLEESVRKACIELGNGRENVRVRLADLRVRLSRVARDSLDKILLELERHGQLSLYRLDNPAEIGPEDQQAAIRTATGNERHIIYFGGRSS